MLFYRIYGTIRRTLSNESTQLKLYKIMAVPTLLDSCETWIIEQEDMSGIQTAEISKKRQNMYKIGSDKE